MWHTNLVLVKNLCKQVETCHMSSCHTINSLKALTGSMNFFIRNYSSSLSALTLLVWQQEGHPACKNSVMGC